MLNFKLALKNIIGAGTRTWLNAIVLSIVFVSMIALNGIIEGMNNSTTNNMKNTIYGGGQFWHKNYDPYDPLTIESSHDRPAPQLQTIIKKGLAEPILIIQGALYPHGRIKNILVKGIDPEQKILDLPVEKLSTNSEYIPAAIGTRMAKKSHLEKNDIVTVRWRDQNGTFDAADVKIVQIMNTMVPTVDNGQIWVPYERMQEMMGTTNQATIIVVKQEFIPGLRQAGVWKFRSLEYLLRDIEKLKSVQFVSYAFMYLLLLFMALLAVFDTQVLSIFHRRKENGTLVALGMDKKQVVSLFTLEGSMYGILSLIIGAIYATPLLIWTARNGIKLPEETGDFGMAISTTLYPIYDWKIIVVSSLVMLISVSVVSYFPARRISDLEPRDVLAGRDNV
ncbi:MAG TPA: FtsX-like permease family protein [bacterium]|nr:FtsX-like permease family protein [bacterium]